MREVTARTPAAFLLIGIVLIYAGLLVLAPIVTIVQGTFSRGLEPIITTFNKPDVRHAFEVTFTLSLGAVLINATAGLITAWVLVRQRFAGRKFLDGLVDIPFVFAPVIAGYVLIVLFGRDGWFAPPLVPIVFALPGVLLAKTFVSLPFVTREVQPVLEALTPEQEEAAYTMGASRWITFWRIVMPEIRVALFYGIILTFARAVGEFGAVAVVSGSIENFTETATSYVFRALNDRQPVGAYGVSLVLGLVSIVVLILMNFFRQRGNPRR